jgi:hypothetical protein
MPLRVLAVLAFVAFFSGYAWRNWFVSLCSSFVLMAFLEHPDMPKSIGGIQGLNPWNILIANIIFAWLRDRSSRGLSWDFPPGIGRMVLLYFGVLFISSIRMLLDPPDIEDYSFGSAISEYFINCFKWVLPGIIFFDGCRERWRVKIAVGFILIFYLLLAIQVIRWMPLSYAVDGDALAIRAAKILENEIGYHRVNMSMMLAGACWAILSTLVLVQKKWHKLGIMGAAAIVALGQALTGGRTGYATWGVIGLFLCVMRWRKMLPAVLIGPLLIVMFLPGVRDRMLTGFGGQQGTIIVQTDESEITSGRSVAWPYVIEKIKESPILGCGRLAMNRTGIQKYLMEEYGEGFPHPHNAYLELLLDNGIVGALLVLPFYFVVLGLAVPMLLNRSDPLRCAVGGVVCSLTLAFLVAGIGSQTFYPREGAVGMWAAFGLLFRLYVGLEEPSTADADLGPDSESSSETEFARA